MSVETREKILVDKFYSSPLDSEKLYENCVVSVSAILMLDVPVAAC